MGVEMGERPIAKCQAIKVKISETGKGVFFTLLAKDKESLPPEENYDGFRDLRVGAVVNLYMTVDE